MLKRVGRNQDKQSLTDHLKDVGPCPMNNEKPLQSVEQGRQQIKDIITLLGRHQAAVGRDWRGRKKGQEDLRRPRQEVSNS